jgi:hypothetical protein
MEMASGQPYAQGPPLSARSGGSALDEAAVGAEDAQLLGQLDGRDRLVGGGPLPLRFLHPLLLFGREAAAVFGILHVPFLSAS